MDDFAKQMQDYRASLKAVGFTGKQPKLTEDERVAESARLIADLVAAWDARDARRPRRYPWLRVG